MSLTMHEYDPVYCDGHFCPKDCEVCQYREENREEDEDYDDETMAFPRIKNRRGNLFPVGDQGQGTAEAYLHHGED